MKSRYGLILLYFAWIPAAYGQNLVDNFTDPIADDFATTSTVWDAVWAGDAWSTALNSGLGVSPKTDVDGPGQFGGSADPFENALVAGEATWRDYSVEGAFYAADDDAVGIVFRYTSPGSFYLLVLSRDVMPAPDGQIDHLAEPQTRLYRISQNTVVQLLDPIPAVAYVSGSLVPQRVRIEIVGTTIRGWLGSGTDPIDTSEQPLFDLNDTENLTVTAGRAGIYAFEMGEEAPGTYFTRFEVRPMDSDGDFKTNDGEMDTGTDPFDADSDDDGIIDGQELMWNVDSDLDGLINALDWDSDDDGLPDGLEIGITLEQWHPDTDISAGHFQPDADGGETTTNHLNPDTDSGGVRDGDEDANRNGRYEPALGETDPNDYSDDDSSDGGPDGDADADTDTDGDGDIDADTDGDTDPLNPSDAGLGGLYGGQDCNCTSIGRTTGQWFSHLLRSFLFGK